MAEDLRKLTGYELERRFASLEVDIASKDFALSQRVKKIEALQAELRAAQDSLAKLEAKKDAEPIPTFELGKCYRNRKGEIIGPLDRNGSTDYPFRFGVVSYTRSGTVFKVLGETDGDLLPGAVDPPPTWTPPASMESGVWKFCIAGMMHPNGRHGFMAELRTAIWRDWTDPPKFGLWQVTDGKATYLGEA